MICTTLQNKKAEEILTLLDNLEMAEIRLDLCPLDEEDIENLFSSSDTPLVATCRAGSGLSWQEAETRLLAAIRAGAAYADLEIEAPPQVGKKVRRACTEHGVTMIRSCHYFDGMPSLDVLRSDALRCSRFGGEIVKIVGTARAEEDAARILSLYEYAGPVPSGKLIAFAMGEAGRRSRIDCLRRGAPFSYSALTGEEAAAPGQWPYPAMRAEVYGNRAFIGQGGHPEKNGSGTPGHPANQPILTMPASKSFAQRAILAAALAEGTSILRGYSPCGDTDAALRIAKALGTSVQVVGNTLQVTGASDVSSPSALRNDREAPPVIPGERRDLPAILHVGESGLLTRLLIPLLAVRNKKPICIDGEGTLLNRPLKDAADIMARFGTLLRSAPASEKTEEIRSPGTKSSGPRRNNTDLTVPLSVQGPLLPGRVELSGKDGSQLISGLLMALPQLSENSELYIREPKSIPYLFITLDVLRKFGIRIGSEMEGDDEFLESQDWGLCTGITFRIPGEQQYRPASFDIEGDWSAAANFLVAGAIFGKAQLEGLDTSSLQADISIMDILMEAGASLSQLDEPLPETGEPVPDTSSHRRMITVQRAPLHAFDTDLGNCPDLFPIVSVLAAFCSGRSHIRGFRRLAGKESDRGTAILTMLAQMGVTASAEGDTMTIEGESLANRCLNGHLLRGGDYTSSHDHRMVMALQVASIGADGPFEIDDTACVAKSFPDFQSCFDRLVHT